MGRIRIAGKLVHKDTHWLNVLAWVCTAQYITHIEMGFYRVCKGLDCPYKCNKKTKFHWVYYTAVLDFDNKPAVRRSIQRDHEEDEKKWVVMEMECEFADEAEAFLIRQLKATYAVSRFRSLPFRKFLTFEPCFRPDYEQKSHPVEDRSEWICSELIANALLVGGLFSPKDSPVGVLTAEDIIERLRLKYGQIEGRFQLKCLVSEDLSL
mgnify:CR=1 FL=1